jgi:ATP-dependent RNA circularization protein (DNA/RNA ligase family)
MPATSERNEKLKATMRDRNTDNLNKSGKEGVVVQSPSQAKNAPKTPTGHVDPYRK